MNNKDFLIKYIEDDDDVILRAYVGKEKIVKCIYEKAAHLADERKTSEAGQQHG